MIATAMPASAMAQGDSLPRLGQIAQPQEQLAARHLSALINGPAEARHRPLPALDAILAETNGSSPLRGVVQLLRATALMNDDRSAEALAAIEESVRLLPTYGGSLLIAASIEAYNDRPDVGGDDLVRAIALDPVWARRMSDDELSNLIGRLRQRHDDRRIALIAERLFASGWHGEDIILRSSLARDRIKARVAEGDLAGARSALPYLQYPPHARQLLTGLPYSSLWPDIEAWTGPLQRDQWRSYLADSRALWQNGHLPAHATAYVQALDSAGYDRTLAREMLPLLMGPLDQRRDYPLIWTVSRVASALARLGRWDEADALFAHVLTIWPFGTDINALNFTANRARLLLYRGRTAESLEQIDRTIADAERRSAEVSAGPLAAMHAVRACALHRLGRDPEAARSVANAAAEGDVDNMLFTYLCLERPEAARRFLIDAIAQERLRSDVADFLQPEDDRDYGGELSRSLAAARESLRHDSALLRAIAPYARILSYSARAGVPAEELGQ